MGKRASNAASASTEPATAAKSKAAKKIETKPEDMKSTSEEESQSLAKQKNNFWNQLKAASKRVEDGHPLEGDDVKCQVLQKWTKLGRYDEEKNKILSLWNKDKSMNWWMTYEETKGSKYTETQDALAGFGSRQSILSFLFAHQHTFLKLS